MKISVFFLRLAWLFIIVILTYPMSGQAPYSFNYQGVARDGSGVALDQKIINLRISLSHNAPDGTIEFQEIQSTTTSDRGLFSIRIGAGNAAIGSLSAIDWGSGTYFIKVEIDPNGGQNFINLGSSQLYSVPYALYALSAGSGTGGSQNLTLDGSILSIEGGNSVDLSSLADGDADPENELQSLSLDNNVLSISGGNSVNLPSGSGEGGGNGSSIWNAENGNAVYDGGGSVIIRENGQNQFSFSTDVEGGFWSLNDENGQFSVFSFAFDSGSGFIGTAGPNGSTNIRLSTSSGNANNGFLGIANEESRSKLGAYVNSNGSGTLYTEGPNGTLNAYITNLSSQADHGFIAVYDSEDVSKAGLYVDENGQGRLFADFVDNFVENPEKSGERIIYTMIQGPESATYLRGTGTMENGVASVDFPSHFSHQIMAQNITVLITPLSEDSKGIAVIKKSTSGFAVKELLQGKGNYQFDWEVKGVRRSGNFKSSNPPVISPSIEERQSSIADELKAKERLTAIKSK